MTKVFVSAKDLEAAGYIEVAPGRYQKLPNKLRKGKFKDPKKSKKPAHLAHIKSGKYVVGSKTYNFRSKWEYIYAKYLEFLRVAKAIESWSYEEKTFFFDGIRRGAVSYLPDFKVVENNGEHYWVEVKGFLTSRAATQLKRMKKYYPKEKIKLVGKADIEGIKKYLSIK